MMPSMSNDGDNDVGAMHDAGDDDVYNACPNYNDNDNGDEDGHT